MTIAGTRIILRHSSNACCVKAEHYAKLAGTLNAAGNLPAGFFSGAQFPGTLTLAGTDMARLTVEDCLENIENRYDLVLLASKRTRQLLMGSDPLIEDQSDKPTVMALREIAAGVVTYENIEAIGRSQFDADIEEIEFQPVDPGEPPNEDTF